jgi:hypothetical protein
MQFKLYVDGAGAQLDHPYSFVVSVSQGRMSMGLKHILRKVDDDVKLFSLARPCSKLPERGQFCRFVPADNLEM